MRSHFRLHAHLATRGAATNRRSPALSQPQRGAARHSTVLSLCRPSHPTAVVSAPGKPPRCPRLALLLAAFPVPQCPAALPGRHATRAAGSRARPASPRPPTISATPEASKRALAARSVTLPRRRRFGGTDGSLQHDIAMATAQAPSSLSARYDSLTIAACISVSAAGFPAQNDAMAHAVMDTMRASSAVAASDAKRASTDTARSTAVPSPSPGNPPRGDTCAAIFAYTHT